MNSFDTLFFPETDIFNEKRYPLLLFFAPLHFLQVVETEPGSDINSEADLFLKSGLCLAHVPAPLGENRKQFLRLLHDISERKEDLVSQLRGLSTDSKPHLAGSEPHDLRQRIVSSLLQEYGVKHAASNADLQLWQSRLVLAIGEVLDSNAEILRDELGFFNKDEITAFRSLQGGTELNEEDPFSELEDIKAQLEKSRMGNIVKRFDAWLHLLHNQPVSSVKVWLASTRDSAEQIFTRYESTGNNHAVPLLKLTLPAQIAASSKYVLEQIEEFHEATSVIHRGLTSDFEKIVRSVPYMNNAHESLLPYGTDWADQWETALDNFFPASRNGRNEITFYLLPNQPLSRLMFSQESSGVTGGDLAHGLLAILGVPQAL